MIFKYLSKPTFTTDNYVLYAGAINVKGYLIPSHFENVCILVDGMVQTEGEKYDYVIKKQYEKRYVVPTAPWHDGAKVKIDTYTLIPATPVTTIGVLDGWGNTVASGVVLSGDDGCISWKDPLEAIKKDLQEYQNSVETKLLADSDYYQTKNIDLQNQIIDAQVKVTTLETQFLTMSDNVKQLTEAMNQLKTAFTNLGWQINLPVL